MPVILCLALTIAFSALCVPAHAAPKPAPEKPAAAAASEPALDVRDPQFAERYAERYRAAMSAKPAAVKR